MEQPTSQPATALPGNATAGSPTLSGSAGMLPASKRAARVSSRKAAGNVAMAAPSRHSAKASTTSLHEFSGNISWYGPGFQGKRTASGQPFDMNSLTSAHRTLPFGTKVQVEDPKSGKVVVVKVTDRGPYCRTRVMDVTREAGRKLDMLLHGTIYANCLVIEE